MQIFIKEDCFYCYIKEGKMFDVITFGSAVVDVFVKTETHEKKNLICYNVGDKLLIDELKFDVGGGSTNTAVAFARLGLKTGCICKLGNDDNAEKILKLLIKERVKFLGKVDEKGMTGYSVILNSKEKSRTVLTYKGVNNELGINELKINRLKSKWIYCSSLMGKSFETQKRLVSLFKKKGVKFAFNPSSYMIKNKNIKSLLKQTDILILNKEEAEILVGKKELLIGLHNLIDKKGIVVITDKNKLTSCFDGNKKYFIKPHNVKVIERTGAGDAFASGFVAGQIRGKSIEESLRLGLEESESVIKYFGAKNNLIKRKLK